MGESAIDKRRETYRRREAAWSFMVAAAQRQHTADRPLTAGRMQSGFKKEIYGLGLRQLAQTFRVTTTTIRTLHRVLALLIEVAEKNGSTHAEVFKRYGGSFGLADKRTRNIRTTYNPWHRKQAQS